VEGKWNARKKRRRMMVDTTSHSKADRGGDDQNVKSET